jgi:hypothetical protein
MCRYIVHLNYAHLLLALALVTFTRSRHALSAFSICVLDLKWLRKKVKQSRQNLTFLFLLTNNPL